MAWDLRGNIDDEIARARLSLGRTPAQVDELYPPYPYERHAADRRRPPGSVTGGLGRAAGRSVAAAVRRAGRRTPWGRRASPS